MLFPSSFLQTEDADSTQCFTLWLEVTGCATFSLQGCSGALGKPELTVPLCYE